MHLTVSNIDSLINIHRKFLIPVLACYLVGALPLHANIAISSLVSSIGAALFVAFSFTIGANILSNYKQFSNKIKPRLSAESYSPTGYALSLY